jgi:hypothetical protein
MHTILLVKPKWMRLLGGPTCRWNNIIMAFRGRRYDDLE